MKDDQKTKQRLLKEIRKLRQVNRELLKDRTEKGATHEHFLQQLIDAIPSPIYFKNEKSIYIGCNRAFEEYLGLPRNRIVGMTMFQTAPRAKALKYSKMDKDLLKNRGVQIYENEIVSADGSRREVEFHKSTFTRIDGSVAGIVGVAFDITERRRLERESRTHAAAIAAAESAVDTISAIADGVVLFDLKGTIKSVNPAFETLSGNPAKKLVGKNIKTVGARLFRLLYKQNSVSIFKAALSGKILHPVMGVLKAADRREIPVIITNTLIRDKKGKPTMVVTTSKDISELVQAQDAVEQSENRFRGLFRSSRDSIVITTWDGRFVDVNQAFVEMVGYKSKATVLKKNINEFYTDPKQRPRMRKLVDRTGFVQNYEFGMKTRTGKKLDTVHTISVRKNPDGTVAGYQGIIRDYTQRNRMQAALREAEKNQLLVSITSFVSSLEARDHYTRGHSEAVSAIVAGMATLAGADETEIENARIGGMLHDIGKIGVRDAILLKPGRLTKKEFDHIKQHPRIGARILRSLPQLADTIGIVLSHHERVDGKGYPNRVRGKKIPLLARMTAVADTYHALTSDRPYRKGMTRKKALGIIREVTGTQLCPECVDLFLHYLRKQKR